MSLEERRRTKDRTPTLSSLSTLCSLAEIFPEVLLRKAPPTVARFWSTGTVGFSFRVRVRVWVWVLCRDENCRLNVFILKFFISGHWNDQTDGFIAMLDLTCALISLIIRMILQGLGRRCSDSGTTSQCVEIGPRLLCCRTFAPSSIRF